MTRLLIVDDDPDIIEALAIMLQDRHQVRTASNGVEALELLGTHTFDAIVLDLMMPLMDGETLIERAREAGITIPIVLASASIDVRALAARLGVEHVLKPYDIGALEEKLVRLTGASPS
jgi:CheY-like chemotaxis protein